MTDYYTNNEGGERPLELGGNTQNENNNNNADTMAVNAFATLWHSGGNVLPIAMLRERNNALNFINNVDNSSHNTTTNVDNSTHYHNTGDIDGLKDIILSKFEEQGEKLDQIAQQLASRPVPPTDLRNERYFQEQEDCVEVSSPSREVPFSSRTNNSYKNNVPNDQQPTTMDDLKALTWHEIVNTLKGSGDVENHQLVLLSHLNVDVSSKCVALFHGDVFSDDDKYVDFQQKIPFRDSAYNVSIELEENSVVVLWEEEHNKCAAELTVLLLKKAKSAAFSSGKDVHVNARSVNSRDMDIAFGIPPLSGCDLEALKCSGNIVFENCQLTEDQQKGLAGVATHVTLSRCELVNGGHSLAVACLSGSHLQELRFLGSYPLTNAQSLEYLLRNVHHAEKLKEIRFVGGAVLDFVKHESFQLFKKKFIEQTCFPTKFSPTLSKFVFDVTGRDHDDKDFFIRKFVQEVIQEHLKGCNFPEVEYEEILYRSRGENLFPLIFRGVSQEQLSTAIMELKPAAMESPSPLPSGTTQNPTEKTSERNVSKEQVPATRSSASRPSSVAPPRRSNRIRGQAVKKTGLPQNYQC